MEKFELQVQWSGRSKCCSSGSAPLTFFSFVASTRPTKSWGCHAWKKKWIIFRGQKYTLGNSDGTKQITDFKHSVILSQSSSESNSIKISWQCNLGKCITYLGKLIISKLESDFLVVCIDYEWFVPSLNRNRWTGTKLVLPAGIFFKLWIFWPWFEWNCMRYQN